MKGAEPEKEQKGKQKQSFVREIVVKILRDRFQRERVRFRKLEI